MGNLLLRERARSRPRRSHARRGKRLARRDPLREAGCNLWVVRVQYRSERLEGLSSGVETCEKQTRFQIPAPASRTGSGVCGDRGRAARLRRGARIRYSTVEFTTDIAINAQGVRDDEPVGPKPADERRIVVLGDSLVFSVQVQQTQTFCERLEQQLNTRGDPFRWRVI